MMNPLESFTTVYMEGYEKLRDVAYNILKNTHDAEDVMQAVMLKLVEKQDELNKVAAPAAFLHRCVRNEAISLLRHKRIAAIPNTDTVMEQAPSHAEDAYTSVENYLYIKAYIKKEPAEIQEAFLAYVLDGYTIVELAKELHMDKAKLARKFRKIKMEICYKPGVLITGIIIVIC